MFASKLHDFQEMRVLGHGGFGTVSVAQHISTSKLYAIKSLHKEHIAQTNQVVHTKTERRVLCHTEHPFIIKLHSAFQTRDKLYMVLDFCPGGDLRFHLNQMDGMMSVKMARFYCAEIVHALIYLHAKGIAHRDLKPENCLIDDCGHIKLVDFGLAKTGVQRPERGAYTHCGTFPYMAPEVLHQRGHGFAVDYWSLGVIAYEMICGWHPWYFNDSGDGDADVCPAGFAKSNALCFPRFVSRCAQDFISSLLIDNPLKRIGGHSCTEHPFFTKINWKLLYSKAYVPPIRNCNYKHFSPTYVSECITLYR
uniref:Protein kinase domain-containing protein n=1 Tax=Leptocylindrus danicus TaxID=163516 RepID=A0A7S2KHB4_9STRA|mmetsp:Transcript_22869/g.34325  ORF Transcript_22869/g.34325 Transcript_22869/m.34325 type:complete len:308 (+) Transcript_22869:129-1052(+)